MRHIWTAAAAVAILAAGAGASSAARVVVTARIVGALAEVAGPPVHVRCSDVVDGGAAEPLGHADARLRLIELQPGVCRELDALVATRPPSRSPAFAAESEALLVAVHEAVHLSPYGSDRDEADVECRAVQLVAETARRIGLDGGQARAAGHAAWAAHLRLPGPGDWRVGLHELPSYQSPDCHAGGPLDIHPGSSDWPN